MIAIPSFADARRIRAHMRAAAEMQTDEQALESIEMFRVWRPNTVYYLGERLQHNGKLYKVNQPELASSEIYPPDAEGVTALYVEVTPPGVIAEWKQPDSVNGYPYGAVVTHNGHTWRSTFDPDGTLGGNIWEPGVFGWEQID